jgi:hypothetical protein
MLHGVCEEGGNVRVNESCYRLRNAFLVRGIDKDWSYEGVGIEEVG